MPEKAKRGAIKIAGNLKSRSEEEVIGLNPAQHNSKTGSREDLAEDGYGGRRPLGQKNMSTLSGVLVLGSHDTHQGHKIQRETRSRTGNTSVGEIHRKESPGNSEAHLDASCDIFRGNQTLTGKKKDYQWGS